MNDSLFPKKQLIPLTQINEDNIKLIRIGEDFVDLARLGMIGEYELIESTKLCPRLYYRWNYQYGKWEIYATEHDLIRYNLIGVSELRSGDKPEPGPDPGPEPEPDPGPDPGPEPEPDPSLNYKVVLTSSDDDWVFNGAVLTFNGLIKWYPKRLGHYVSVNFKIGKNYIEYLDSLVVTYRGAKYDRSIFNGDSTTILISVRVLNQIVPIRFDFTDEIYAQYYIKVSSSAKFELPYKPGEESKGEYVPGSADPDYDIDPSQGDGVIGDGIINTLPEITTFLEGFDEGSRLLDYTATDEEIENLFDVI